MTGGDAAPAPSMGRFLGLVISAALLLLLIQHFDGFCLLKSARPDVLFGALLLALFLDTTVGAYKWQQVLALLGIRLRFADAWRLWTGLLPATFFAPFQSGHVLYAVALEKATAVGYPRAIEAVAYDKYLSLVATFAWIAVGQALLPDGHDLRHPVVLLLGLGGVAVWFSDRLVLAALGRIPAVRSRSRLVSMRVSFARKVGLLVLAMVYQSSDSLSMLLGCIALGLHPDPYSILGGFPVVLLLSYAPVGVSGFGVREGFAGLLLGGGVAAGTAAGLGWDGAVAGALLVDFLEYVAPALFGLVALPYLIKVLDGSSSAFRESPGGCVRPAASSVPSAIAAAGDPGRRIQ